MITIGEIMACTKVDAVFNSIVVGEAKKRAKAARRAERWARFESTVRDGLGYSRTVGKRLTKHKGDGGARLEFQMRRIIS